MSKALKKDIIALKKEKKQLNVQIANKKAVINDTKLEKEQEEKKLNKVQNDITEALDSLSSVMTTIQEQEQVATTTESSTNFALDSYDKTMDKLGVKEIEYKALKKTYNNLQEKHSSLSKGHKDGMAKAVIERDDMITELLCLRDDEIKVANEIILHRNKIPEIDKDIAKITSKQDKEAKKLTIAEKKVDKVKDKEKKAIESIYKLGKDIKILEGDRDKAIKEKKAIEKEIPKVKEKQKKEKEKLNIVSAKAISAGDMAVLVYEREEMLKEKCKNAGLDYNDL